MNTLTPAELSALALEHISKNPLAHGQDAWHSHRVGDEVAEFRHPCGTAHCWAGHIDLILGVPRKHTTGILFNPVQDIMGMSHDEWAEMTNQDNSVARLKALHRLYFVDGVFGCAGYDEDGYDKAGYDKAGYDKAGYDEYGYDQDGYDEDGYDVFGYGKDGYDEYGYDKAGCDKDGYDEDGDDECGYAGYDEDGYDKAGYDEHGYDKYECDKAG
jgi:hypothetical protein